MEKKLIEKIEDIDYYQNINLEKYTTIKLSNYGDLIICKSLESLKALLQSFPDVKFHIIGWGANQVLLNTKETTFLKLNFPFKRSIFEEARDFYDLPASISLNTLTSHAMKFGLRGWEVFTGVPASLGGAIAMNAGTSLGEIGEVVKAVDIMDRKGNFLRRELKTSDFSYRSNKFLNPGDIIVGATLTHKGLDGELKGKIQNYLKMRKETQPLTARTCGSVFKNLTGDIRAGMTIDACGLKGIGSETIQVSHKHANFIENFGEAKPEEFSDLVECLKIDIERFSGHKFELEVKVY